MCEKEGFHYFNDDYCVKLLEPASKREHEDQCNNLGGKLFVPKSFDETEVLKAYIRKQDIADGLYVGIEFDENVWKRDEDESVVYMAGKPRFHLIFAGKHHHHF